jgi:hypothetical protein
MPGGGANQCARDPVWVKALPKRVSRVTYRERVRKILEKLVRTPCTNTTFWLEHIVVLVRVVSQFEGTRSEA